jgi:flagellar basal body-associated protein FliL
VRFVNLVPVKQEDGGKQMKTKKWFIFMIVVVLMMALMVGCGGGSPDNDGEGEEEPEEEGDANGGNSVASLSFIHGVEGVLPPA